MTGRVPSEAARRAISRALKGKPQSKEHKAKVGAWHKGRPKSLEQRAKISETKRNSGWSPSPEHRKAIGDKCRGKPRPREVMEKVRLANLGRKLSPAHCEAIGAARRGKKQRPEAIAARKLGQNLAGPRNGRRFKGIGKWGHKFCAEIKLSNGVTVKAGGISTEEQAAVVFDWANRIIHGGQCYVNFPLIEESWET